MDSQDKIIIHFENKDPYELDIDYILKKDGSIFKVNEYENFTIEIKLSSNRKVYILTKSN